MQRSGGASEREHAEFLRLGVILTNVSTVAAAAASSIARRLNKVIFPSQDLFLSLSTCYAAAIADTPILRCSSRIIP